MDFLLSEDRESFDSKALSGLKVTTLSPGRCVCSFFVTEGHTNRYGTLHGGCTATLADVVSTVALTTSTELSGVSVNLAVTYLSPMPGGQEVIVDAQVVKIGKSLATINVTFSRKSDGAAVAVATHTKFIQAATGSKAATGFVRSKL
ncbi:MAG: hypothetical protein WDW36_003925 [Sanguina aurantia]